LQQILNMVSFSLTLAIIVITCLVSFGAFNNQKITNDLIFYPPAVTHNKQYYRFITSGLIHADPMHLIFNMLTLWFFGRSWETVYVGSFGVEKYMFIVLYVSALILSEIPSYLKHRNDEYYTSLGASGAVSAIVFSIILLAPWQTFYVIVFPVPAIIYALLFLGISFYMGRKGGDRINHDAHFWGAIVGVVFTLILRPEVWNIFISQLTHPQFNF
jgi:membrane associated rhomboid family serine protease